MTTLSFSLLIALMNKNIAAACESLLAANAFTERMFADDVGRLTALLQRYADLFEKQQAAAKLTFVLDETAVQLHDLDTAIAKLKADAAAFEAAIAETYTSCMDTCTE